MHDRSLPKSALYPGGDGRAFWPRAQGNRLRAGTSAAARGKFAAALAPLLCAVAFLVALIATGSGALAQQRFISCGPRHLIEQQIAQGEGKHRAHVGDTDAEGVIVEIWIDADGRWVALSVHVAAAGACIVGRGTNWRVAPEGAE